MPFDSDYPTDGILHTRKGADAKLIFFTENTAARLPAVTLQLPYDGSLDSILAQTWALRGELCAMANLFEPNLICAETGARNPL